MAFRSFEVLDRKGLRRAAATEFPNLAVIAGPNGSGKSTLLHELYVRRDQLAEPGTNVAYLGPHRGWRRTNMGLYGLGEIRSSLSEYLREPVVPGWRQFQPPGFQHIQVGVQRDPTGTDETFSFVKSAILKIDFRLQSRLREVWEAEGHEIRKGQVADAFEPLKKAVRALLPHLDFNRVDAQDDNNLRVLFTRTDGQYLDEVELDDLSSGEKSAIGLVLPTVDQQISRLMGDQAIDGPLPTTLIDEPETHLHPSLQVLLLDYLLGLAENNEAQFILSTHSPTIVDSMSEGLYLLAPSSQVPDGNQLIPLTSTGSRLDAMRALTGATHLLTRCRPIIFLEGERPQEKPISDQRLVEMLVPQAAGWVLVSATGKRQVVGAANQLREAIAAVIPGLPVFALVDADQHQDDDPDWVVKWPVSMIENLLLDADAIWAVLQPSRESLNLASAADVRQKLLEIASGMREDEIRLRIPALQRAISIRIRPADREDLIDSIARARAEFDEELSAVSGQVEPAAWDEAATEVDSAISDGRQLEVFRGKTIFGTFYESHAKQCGLSKKAFAYAVAAQAVSRPRCDGLVGNAVKRISNFIPLELIASAQALLDNHGGELGQSNIALSIDAIRAARVAWEADLDLPHSLESLREHSVSIARRADSLNEPALAEQIRRATSRIGARRAR